MAMIKEMRSQKLTVAEPSSLFVPGLGVHDKLRERMIKRGSRFERIAMDPNSHLYLDDWAVSAYEKFGLNENSDGFERAELKNCYGTFVGAWVCLDHDNDHFSKTVGENIDAVYTPDDYVRVIMAVERERAERRHPGLEGKIARGEITDTSMGCICRESCCTVCANVASDETQFCDHVTAQRGQMIATAQTKWMPVKAGELNRGVMFFENSIITNSEGADPNAKIVSALAIRQAALSSARTGVVTIDAEKLYKTLRAMTVTASITERAVIATLVEKITQDLLP